MADIYSVTNLTNVTNTAGQLGVINSWSDGMLSLGLSIMLIIVITATLRARSGTAGALAAATWFNALAGLVGFSFGFVTNQQMLMYIIFAGVALVIYWVSSRTD